MQTSCDLFYAQMVCHQLQLSHQCGCDHRKLQKEMKKSIP